MLMAVLITVLYIVAVWLVFYKFKWLKFNIAWGIVSFWVGLHLLLVFVVALRFFQPYSIDGRIIRHTVQIVPRLPEPTKLMEVLVEANTPVQQGQPLFKFDPTLYQAQVKNAAAALAAAKQNVKILQEDITAAQASVQLAEANQAFAADQKKRFENLVKQGAGRAEELDRWTDELESRTAGVNEAEANLRKAQLAYDSQIDGVNTSVVQAAAALDEAQYYLDQTTIVAPEDGMITNLQARPGLVVGIVRIGAIATWVAEDDPYILASYFQEHLRFVEEGQPVEVALDTYPGFIFTGTVKKIWWATGQGQINPSGDIPSFLFPKPQGRFAVQIVVDPVEGLHLPAGGHGAVAIYTGRGKGFEPLRRIGIRLYSWANWLYPLDFL
ncbi:MAG: HlyD family secretion protein [Pseudomonadota bacterium]